MSNRRWYEHVAGGVDLNLVLDPQEFSQATDLDQLAIVTDLQGLSDEARAVVAASLGLASAATYDDMLQDQEWELRDRLDYYSLYSNKTVNLTVRDGAWFTPDLVESFCGETGGDVVGNSIDGLNSTYWRHTQNHNHSVIYKLRDYPKKVARIRFRYNGSLNREELNNITVRASRSLNTIDDPGNLLESGINPTWPGGPAVWVEHTLANKKNQARYVKLEFDTAHGSNDMQMREFAVWVETRDP